MSGIISFLGGTAFRWLVGSLLDSWAKHQDHKRELDMMRLQLEQDAMRHEWQQQAIHAQAAAGIQVIEAQSVQGQAAAADLAFLSAVQGANAASNRPDWIGAWNASIRPALATMAILLLLGEALAPSVVTLSALTAELVCAVLGVFVGDRIRGHATGRVQ